MDNTTVNRTAAPAAPLDERGGVRPKPVDAQMVGQLMARVADGDTGSFAALYDALAPYAYRLVGSVDVMEEAFTTIWRTARRCPTDGGEALMWAMDIMYQHALAGSGPAGGARQHVTALTSGQRASTTLTCGGALTYRQVADLIGEPPHAVALLQRDALIRLRDWTAEQR